MRPLSLAILAAILLFPAAAFAAPPPAIVAAVKARVEAVIGESFTPEEMADPAIVPPAARVLPDRMFKQVDINGDSWPDWQVSYGKANLPVGFCGTGGCLTQIWAGQASGPPRLVFDTQVRQLAIRGP